MSKRLLGFDETCDRSAGLAGTTRQRMYEQPQGLPTQLKFISHSTLSFAQPLIQHQTRDISIYIRIPGKILLPPSRKTFRVHAQDCQ